MSTPDTPPSLEQDQATLLRECRAAIQCLLDQRPGLSSLVCGSTTLGNLRASLAGYRDFSAVVMPTSTMGNDAPQNALNRQTLKGSEMATLLRDSVQHYGDHPVFFTDGFFRYGVALYPACAPNHDRPNALLVRAFSLVTGRDGPWAPIQLEHE